MATLNEIIYILKNEINDYSNDYKVSNRQFEFMINYNRAQLIRQRITKGQSISAGELQNLAPVPVGRVNVTDNPTLKAAGDIIATITEIPNPIKAYDKDMFTYIGGIDRTSPFDFSSRANTRWATYNKYTGNYKRSFYRDNRIYLTGCETLPLQTIWIEGIFEDPREVYNFQQNVLEELCPYPFQEMEYPINEDIIPTLVDMIKTKDLNLKFILSRDNKNDGTASEPEQTKSSSPS